MRANIYSLEPLEAATRESLHDGIGAVAAYMGESLVQRELQVKLPTTDGFVQPERIGFNALDKMVELHIMAVPLKPVGNRIGTAARDTGISFVDITSDFPGLVRTTTAHEVAHSLGFVLENSGHVNQTSPGHCSALSCIMHEAVTTQTTEQLVPIEQTRIDKMLRRPVKMNAEQRYSFANKQFDFCDDCKHDLYTEGSKQLNLLRNNRLFNPRGVRFHA